MFSPRASFSRYLHTVISSHSVDHFTITILTYCTFKRFYPPHFKLCSFLSLLTLILPYKL